MHFVLLGPGPEAAAVHALADLGHEITVLYTERNRDAVLGAADRIKRSGFVPSYDCPELAWASLIHLGATHDVHSVIPVHEMAVTTAAFLNDALQLPAAHGPVAAMAGRDKAFQKSLWERCGVPTSRHVALTNTPQSLADLETQLGELQGPFIVKPPAMGGSTLVSECSTTHEVYVLLSNNPALRHAVVEEKQNGTEWHFDGVLKDGRVQHLMVSRYLAPLLETKRGLTNRSVSFPPHQHVSLYADAGDFAQAAVSALNGISGVFHLEVFGEPGQFVAGELAWRPSGALASLVAVNTIGLDLWTAHVRSLVGSDVVLGHPKTDAAFGFACLPVSPGRRNGVSHADIEALPGVRHVRMRVPLGEVMTEATTSTVCVAMVLVEGSDIQSCERLIDDACQSTYELHQRLSNST
ncbi:hypothetical protein GTY65_24535 [Streptomyces sp. SID8379]|uniref:hypothetical protein n=1 Tax=unclassified Streptomyces TaxID=2593676 RepID=UPI00131A30D1|nr:MULTISPECIES: hypothetical protein [unclassified Streptomyces]MYW67210.1 hypothetical protein [Streptomyces sp. SID8379]